MVARRGSRIGIHRPLMDVPDGRVAFPIDRPTPARASR